MEARESIGIGLMGLGVAGAGVARVLVEKEGVLAKQVGCPLSIRKILVRHPSKPRAPEVEPHLLTTNPQEILADPGVDIVVELMGGRSPALEYIKEAIVRGKHVITANKEVMSTHGIELLALAQKHEVDIRYEASVGGGIPLIAAFQQYLVANEISAIHAIINGTTNYILTRMTKKGVDFSAALKQAQQLGYAEADPTNDIEGLDAAHKLAILASLAFRTAIQPQDVYREGIARLAWRDFLYAQELGYAIKLLAIAKQSNDYIEMRVHPTFIPEDFLLAKVDGVYNAVQLEGDLVGKVLFYGEGAGALPTSSAVVADIINLAKGIYSGAGRRPGLRFEHNKTVKPMSEVETRYYLRITLADQPGVLAQIARVLGEHLISISSVIQKESDPATQTAEVVIMTQHAREQGMQQALKEMEQLAVVREINNFIRVEA
ncbi:homoserine dehydrogenase [Chloroflexota bacterium]